MKNSGNLANTYKTLCFSRAKLRQHIHLKLENYQPKSIIYKELDYREAAVIIPLFFKDDQAHILFTKRTEHLQHHKGQISFPGGMRDEEDASTLDTAFRETHEELGIEQGDLDILGPTDRFLTPTNFFIHPYSAFFSYPYPFRVSDQEIDRLIEVPLWHLLQDNNFTIKKLQREGQTWNVHYYHYNDDIIWGVTGFLLSNFLSIVFGLNRDIPETGPLVTAIR